MMQTGIIIRVNLQEGYSALINSFLEDEDFECKFVIRHAGKHKDNPHLHISLITNLSIPTTRARLKKCLNTQGNKQYSMKKWNLDKKFIQYCLHECTTMEEVRSSITHNTKYGGSTWWDEPTLQQLLKQNLVIQTNIKANQPHKVMVDIYNTIDWEMHISDVILFKYIMRAYISRGDWLPNHHQILRYMNYLRVMRAQILDNTTGNQNHQEEFLDQLYKNYFLR